MLNKSYRIPHLHHTLSKQVIERVVGRRPKSFTPKDEQGCS
jgi:hypothetical protein